MQIWPSGAMDVPTCA